MNSHHASPWNVVWLTLWAIIHIGLATGIQHSINHQRGTLKAKQTKEFRDLTQRLNEELSLKEQDLRAAARDAADRRQRELESKLGGPVQAAFKNPEYSLREALQRAAFASAPTNSDARVTVDRFTEFAVTFSRDQKFSEKEMTAAARQILPVAAKYLDAIRFSVQGAVIAELDRQDIEYTDDWTRLPDSRISSLLAREIPADAAQDPAAIEQLKQERDFDNLLSADPELLPKIREARRNLMAAFKAASEDLTAAITSMEKATSLAGINKPSDIDRAQKDLTDAAARAKTAQAFFLDPAQKWRENLQAQAINGEPLETLVKSLPVLIRHDNAKAAKVFEALDARLDSSRFFLKIAAEQYGHWQFNAEFGQFGFTTQTIANRFHRAREQVIADSQALEAAARIWNEAVAP